VNCIKCNADNKLKDRTSGRCKSCRHEFAFDPKVMSGIDFTDRFFQQTLGHISVNGTLFFTPTQLYYAFNHRRNAKKYHPLQKAGGCSLVVVVLLFVFFGITLGFSFLWFFPLLLIAGFAVALLASSDLRRKLTGVRTQELEVPPEYVEGWYKRWTKINGPSPKLLPPLVSESRNPQPISEELRKYSFDRAVVCDRAEIAQFLIANNFHFEYNCAVLSIDGYPHDISTTVMQMLRANSALSVYALHDASIRGLEMVHTLRTSSDWFAGTTAKIFDLGLLPRQILDRSVFVEKRPRIAEALPPHLASTLQPEEVRWFEEGNFVALESFSPKMLLRVVAQGISKSRDPQASDALAPVGTEADGGFFYFYAFDSFG
jgi:hypothetical protein